MDVSRFLEERRKTSSVLNVYVKYHRRRRLVRDTDLLVLTSVTLGSELVARDRGFKTYDVINQVTSTCVYVIITDYLHSFDAYENWRVLFISVLMNFDKFFNL